MTPEVRASCSLAFDPDAFFPTLYFKKFQIRRRDKGRMWWALVLSLLNLTLLSHLKVRCTFSNFCVNLQDPRPVQTPLPLWQNSCLFRLGFPHCGVNSLTMLLNPLGLQPYFFCFWHGHLCLLLFFLDNSNSIPLKFLKEPVVRLLIVVDLILCFLLILRFNSFFFAFSNVLRKNFRLQFFHVFGNVKL
jgi:hypothetical protein